MAIRVVSVTNPAAGADWTFKVPGQWLPYLYGVSATLGTSTALASFADTSGNGRNATINSASLGVLGVQGPYAAGLNNFAISTPGTFAAGGGWMGLTANFAAFAVAAGTIEWWEYIAAEAPGATTGIIELFESGNSAVGIFQVAAGGDPYDVNVALSTPTTHVYTNIAPWGSWHHFAVTWDGVTVTIYKDGASFGSHASGSPVYSGGVGAMAVGGARTAPNPPNGRQAGVALFGAALAAGTIATHAAANSTATAYQTALNASTPLGLWLLNDLPTLPTRNVTLKITDGTRTVAQFPATFVSATVNSATWSWQVLGPGAQTSNDGTTNSVPIPELRVDAGYVISTQTLDIAGTDQWSNIKIWFDDGTGPTDGGGLLPTPYGNAFIVPDYAYHG